MDRMSKDKHRYLTREEVHEELLKLLLRFDAFCKEHGLNYSLDSGTLLGAVRRKGFIPWDDVVGTRFCYALPVLRGKEVVHV